MKKLSTVLIAFVLITGCEFGTQNAAFDCGLAALEHIDEDYDAY
jgi:hypothetical protein